MTTVPAMLECTKVYITDKPLYNYRRGNEASLIGRNYSKDNFEDIWKVIDAFSSLKKGFSEKELLSAAFCMIRSIIKRVLNSNCSFKEQRSYIKQIVKDARVVKLVSRIDKERMTKIYRVWYTLIRYKLVSAIIIGDKLRSR